MKVFAVTAIVSVILTIVIEIIEAQTKMDVIYNSFMLFVWTSGLVWFITCFKVEQK